MVSVPTLVVITMIARRASTVSPRPSVSCPWSRKFIRKVRRPSAARSTSSNSTTHDVWLTADFRPARRSSAWRMKLVSSPPSLYPT